ncbi:MAG: hypothetical protein HQK49_10640 [Oligoflexia bacterium]|nr:hypothetical protein [Oligoflexia bacterium]
MQSILKKIEDIFFGNYDLSVVDQKTRLFHFHQTTIFDNFVSYLKCNFKYRVCIDTIKFHHNPDLDCAILLLNEERSSRIIATCKSAVKIKIPSMMDYFEKDNDKDNDKDNNSIESIGATKGAIYLLKNGDLFVHSKGPVFENQFKTIVPSISWSFLWDQWVRKIFELKTPLAIQAMKVVLCELERINNHINYMITIVRNLGGLADLRDHSDFNNHIKESINFCQEIFSILFISDFHYNYGVNNQYKYDLALSVQTAQSKIDGHLLNRILEFITKFKRFILVFEKRIFSLHLRYKLQGKMEYEGDNILRLSSKVGLSGPYLRALGVSYDVRKSFPYLLYSQIDFYVPVGASSISILGNILNMRMEEMKESLKIIDLIVKNFPQLDVLNVLDVNNKFGAIDIECIEKIRKKLVYEAFEGSEGEMGISAVIVNCDCDCDSYDSGSGSGSNSTLKKNALFKMDIEYKLKSAAIMNSSIQY